ncbi:MAG: dihydrofolate reductase family protein [Ignavibacteriales bacterium]|nr:dihydrofolate reductase family protein [Ignavibacteriales bacterium]
MSDERKVNFAINVTLDGYTDHTVMIADEERLDFFANLLDDVGLLLFGRVTFQMMESYWPTADNDPNATVSEKNFAKKFNALPKIVFSQTLQKTIWNDSRIVRSSLVDEVKKLKKQPGKDISAGSISVFQELMRHNLIDEYWLVVQPLICAKGKRLFDGVNNTINLKLVGTKQFASGVVALHYLKKN